MARKKKQHHEGHVNHERWLVSYADFITLLFAFFVVMYAISDLNSRKAKQVSKSVRFAMHFAGSGGTNELGLFGGRSMDKSDRRKGGVMGNMDQWVRESTTVYEFLAKDLGEELTSNDNVSKSVDERGVVVQVPARWLFEAGGARTTEKAGQYLTKILASAKKYHKDVMIAGSTARVAYAKDPKYQDTVDLQLARLAALERIAIEQFQFPPDRLQILSQTTRSRAGTYASAAQVERAATVELIVLR